MMSFSIRTGMWVLAVSTILISANQGVAQDQRLLEPASVAQRIEANRKADVSIQVINLDGEPVSDAKVQVRQISSAFNFGCAALSLLKHSNSDQEKTYQARFKSIFNFATILTYWHDMEPEQGKLNEKLLLDQSRWLKSNGIYVKGHPILLAGSTPRWLPNNADQARSLNLERTRSLVSRYKQTVDAWDVVGDVTTGQHARNGNGAWIKRDGGAKVVQEMFEDAKRSDARSARVYNEYNLDEALDVLLAESVKRKTPIDVVGLEAHMTGRPWKLEDLWNHTERFAKHGFPIHWSELTVLSDDPLADHRASWPSTLGGEARQADYVERLYSLLFSHPAVTGIMWWNFVDGDWDRHPGGLLRSDLSPKPAYERLSRLINQEWRTNLTASTNADGKMTFRAFHGEYEVRVVTPFGAQSKRMVIRPNASNRLTLVVQ